MQPDPLQEFHRGRDGPIEIFARIADRRADRGASRQMEYGIGMADLRLEQSEAVGIDISRQPSFQTPPTDFRLRPRAMTKTIDLPPLTGEQL